MVTFKDVAKEAGVSPATVSYALRGGEHVSAHTMRRVREAAAKLGYTVNPAARNLRRGHSGVIQVIVHEFDAPYFYSWFAEVVSETIRKAGYHALVQKTGMDGERMRETIARIAGQSCDGLILNPSGLPADTVKQLSANLPTVLLDGGEEPPVFDTVMTPSLEGMRVATGHLIAQGCRKLVFVGCGKPDEQMVAEVHAGVQLALGPARATGFLSAMQSAGLECGAERFIDAGMWVEPGIEAGHRLADGGLEVDGVVCATDSLAFGMIRGLADRGVRVPDDIRVIGFDGISLGAWSVPTLSTIRLDMEDFAGRAVDMLVSRIDGSYQGGPRRQFARWNLVARESSR